MQRGSVPGKKLVPIESNKEKYRWVRVPQKQARTHASRWVDAYSMLVYSTYCAV